MNSSNWRQRHPWLTDMLSMLVVGTLIAVMLYLVRGRHFLPHLVYSICISLAIGNCIGLLQHGVSAWLRRTRPDDPALCNNWPGWAWMLPCVLLGAIVGYMAGTWLGDQLLGHRSTYLWEGRLASALLTLAFVVLVSLGVTLYFYARERLQALEIERAQVQRQAAEAQLRALQSQLEPHMLFNTLAHLRVLIKLRPDDAQQMLDQLIAFLRATLQASRVESHPLGTEFERLRDYLALMQLRMGARLRPELDLPPELAALPVPPLLLQPLVENAIKHGLEPSVDGGLLRVSARRVDAGLQLEVLDGGVGLGAAPASDGTGFGLEQVRERLRTRYGAAAALSLQAQAGGGSLARITIPL